MPEKAIKRKPSKVRGKTKAYMFINGAIFSPLSFPSLMVVHIAASKGIQWTLGDTASGDTAK
ncbi:hypothetical protein BJX64DRAFT_206753 [Aspergillus heterothallicus]